MLLRAFGYGLLDFEEEEREGRAEPCSPSGAAEPAGLRATLGKRSMARVLISYFDHNVILEPLLPRSGVLSDRKKIGGRDDWYFVTLEEPFELSSYSPAKRVEHFAIASRWQGCRIEDPEGTSVFLLVPKEEPFREESEMPLEKFDHIAWGMAKIIS